MNLRRKWGYILMFLLAVHLPAQKNAEGSQKKTLKAIRNLVDEKMTDFLETRMKIVLEEKLTKIVGEKIEEYMMERFDILEENFGKLIGTQCDLGLGAWSSWTSWGVCTASCGGGQRQRTRTCSQPPLSNGEQTCLGSSSEYENCNQDTCPKDCPDGFFRMTNSSRCFTALYDEKTDWGAAQIKCREMGLQLSTNIDDIAIPMRKYILDTFGEGNKWVWINARGSGRGEDNYIWQEEELDQHQQDRTVDKSLLDTGFRGESSTEHCLGLIVAKTYWTAEPGHPYGAGPCGSRVCYPLCEIIGSYIPPTTTTLQPTTTTISSLALSTGCQDGFFRMVNSTRCFSVLDARIKWNEAQIKCQELGLQLATNIDEIAVQLRKYILVTYGEYHEVWTNARGSGWGSRRGDDTYIWHQEEEDQQQLDPVDKNMLYFIWGRSASTGNCLTLRVEQSYLNKKPGKPYAGALCGVYRAYPLCEMISE